MTHRLRVRPEARADLRRLYDWIADEAGQRTADRYLSDLVDVMEGLTAFPNRGRPRADIREGMRSLSHRKRDLIAYTVEGDEVIILRILHAGQDIEGAVDASGQAQDR